MGTKNSARVVYLLNDLPLPTNKSARDDLISALLDNDRPVLWRANTVFSLDTLAHVIGNDPSHMICLAEALFIAQCDDASALLEATKDVICSHAGSEVGTTIPYAAIGIINAWSVLPSIVVTDEHYMEHLLRMLGMILRRYGTTSHEEDRELPNWYSGTFTEALNQLFNSPAQNYYVRILAEALQPIPKVRGPAAKMVFDQLLHKLFGSLGHQLQTEVLVRGLVSIQNKNPA